MSARSYRQTPAKFPQRAPYDFVLFRYVLSAIGLATLTFVVLTGYDALALRT